MTDHVSREAVKALRDRIQLTLWAELPKRWQAIILEADAFLAAEPSVSPCLCTCKEGDDPDCFVHHPPASEGQEPVCWFIERGTGEWWTGEQRIGWTRDPNRAVRFSRREDADAVILGRDFNAPAWRDCNPFASEHIFFTTAEVAEARASIAQPPAPEPVPLSLAEAADQASRDPEYLATIIDQPQASAGLVERVAKEHAVAKSLASFVWTREEGDYEWSDEDVEIAYNNLDADEREPYFIGARRILAVIEEAKYG